MSAGMLPLPLDVPPLDPLTSDTSDYQDGSHLSALHVGGVYKTPPSKPERSCDSGKRKWRRKRRQSACKDDKLKECSFSEKVLNSNWSSRRQSLPLIKSAHLSLGSPPPPHMDQNVASPVFLDVDEEVEDNEEEGLECGRVLSRDSTPGPNHSGTPISPNGTLSPEVTALINSVRSSFRHTHKQSGSTASIRVQEVGSNFVKTASIETSLLKTQFQAEPQSMLSTSKVESAFPCSESSSEIPFSNVDTCGSDFESNKEDSEEATLLQNLASNLNFDYKDRSSRLVGVASKPTGTPISVKDVCRNESSWDTRASDGQGNEADGESTSGTEPNETTSSQQPESDEVTSYSTPEPSDNLDTHSHSGSSELQILDLNCGSGVPVESRSCDSPSGSHEPICSLAKLSDSFPLYYPVSDNNVLTTTTLLPSSWCEATPSDHSPAYAAEDHADNSDAEIGSTNMAGLSIPFHIRRPMSPERRDDGRNCNALYELFCYLGQRLLANFIALAKYLPYGRELNLINE